MSVVVIGMEEPERCPCELAGGYYIAEPCFAGAGVPYMHKEFYQCVDNGTRPDWCPLRPLPDAHGRLIDANALHLLLERRWHDLQILDWDENPHAEDIQTGVNWCLNTLHDDAPTIIEAEGGSDE